MRLFALIASLIMLGGCAPSSQLSTFSQLKDEGKIIKIMVISAPHPGVEPAVNESFVRSLVGGNVDIVSGDPSLIEMAGESDIVGMVRLLKSEHVSHVLLIEPLNNDKAYPVESYAPLWVAFPDAINAHSKKKVGNAWLVRMFRVDSERMVWMGVTQDPHSLLNQWHETYAANGLKVGSI